MPDPSPNYLAMMLPTLNAAEAAEIGPSAAALKVLGLEDTACLQALERGQ